jgi:hypothetical protein
MAYGMDKILPHATPTQINQNLSNSGAGKSYIAINPNPPTNSENI